MRRMVIALILTGAGATAAGCAGESPTPAESPSAAVIGLTPGSVRADLRSVMATAGCKGDVIGGQPDVFEVGRCVLPDGTDVTVVTSPADYMIQSWISTQHALGMSVFVGPGWAAAANPAGAASAATSLGGAKA